ncbi:hypothetical protein MO867_01570 [Microbulbifer sp. OS29]|uniref:Uncharacterized protein n=1 Tax=Microbulbifer okhotskensis TaxID=2926617 RepID=A0A9X2ENS8_9GAMM|nr:hypothetical protein [Microbulbifer okhotskensis]MCO1333018.1 hypothetical protein [Microbulbifer okhotskensis]
MIELVIPGLCLLACTASIFLLRNRRRANPLDYGLQLAIWLSAWMLWQPPAIVTAERHAHLDSEEVASALPVNLSGVETLTLSGMPLSRDALRDLAPVRLNLSSTPIHDAGWGFYWQRQVTLGESLQFQIHSTQPLAENTQFSLLNPYGDIEDSLDLKAGEKVQAQLSATPKLSGPQLYQVRIDSAAGESRFEPLPVVVQQPLQPKVLLWLARPSFETAALSRWLRQSGVATQVMTQLAPEIIRMETLNGLQLNEAQDLLAETSPFDLLILDSDLWPQFTPQQRRQLDSLDSQKSLLWIVSGDYSKAFLQYSSTQSMSLHKAGNTKSASNNSIGFGSQQAHTATTPSLATLGFQVIQPGATDFLMGNRENPLFWGRSTEEQHLGFILFSDSHRWLTSGFATEFASLWKSIINHQLKHLGSRLPIILSSELPRAQQRITLCSPKFNGTSPLLFDTRNESQPISGVAESSNTRGQCHTFWPSSAGWHQLKAENNRDLPFDFYVFAKKDWPLWQHALNTQQTQQMATARLGPIDNTDSSKVPIGRLWPALLLLLLVCLSWWRERALLH